jgi:hypothetical protein
MCRKRRKYEDTSVDEYGNLKRSFEGHQLEYVAASAREIGAYHSSTRAR